MKALARIADHDILDNDMMSWLRPGLSARDLSLAAGRGRNDRSNTTRSFAATALTLLPWLSLLELDSEEEFFEERVSPLLLEVLLMDGDTLLSLSLELPMLRLVVEAARLKRRLGEPRFGNFGMMCVFILMSAATARWPQEERWCLHRRR